jgi:hypothetical protein
MPPAARSSPQPGQPAPLGQSHPPLHHLQGGWLDERQVSYRRIACERCAAVVEAAKFSAQHTSVQWSPDAVAVCAEFALHAAGGQRSALIDGCTSLHASIDLAVSEGRLEVSPP